LSSSFVLPFKSNVMRQFLINLGITVASFYVVVSFVSFLPNPLHWDVGGRAAFTMFSVLVSLVATAIQEAESERKLSNQ
jgi:uncharacterized membrane protein